MNIFRLEEKFQKLDQKDKQVRQFYNPKLRKVKQHHFMKDIREDFQYDSLLYGLGMFWNYDSDTKIGEPTLQQKQEQPIKPPPQPVVKPSLKKGREMMLMKPLAKDNYQGVFSNTKVLKHDYLYKKPKLDFQVFRWKTTGENIQLQVSNKAAQNEIRDLKKYEPDIQTIGVQLEKFRAFQSQRYPKIQKDITQDEFKIFMQQFNNLTQSNKKKLTLKQTDQKPSLTKEQDVQIFSFPPVPHYQTDYRLQISLLSGSSGLFSVHITDLSVAKYPKQVLDSIQCDGAGILIFSQQPYLNCLEKLSWAKGPSSLAKHTLRIQVFNSMEEEMVDKYVHFAIKNAMEEVLVRAQVQQYVHSLRTESEQSPKRPSNDTTKQVTLKEFHGSPIKSPGKVKLPPINQNVNKSKNIPKNFENPLTQALYNYKQNLEAFHPQSYPANLSIFEIHDFIEQRYSRPGLRSRLEQEEVELEGPELGVEGVRLPDKSFI